MTREEILEQMKAGTLEAIDEKLSGEIEERERSEAARELLESMRQLVAIFAGLAFDAGADCARMISEAEVEEGGESWN